MSLFKNKEEKLLEEKDAIVELAAKSAVVPIKSALTGGAPETLSNMSIILNLAAFFNELENQVLSGEKLSAKSAIKLVERYFGETLGYPDKNKIKELYDKVIQTQGMVQ